MITKLIIANETLGKVDGKVIKKELGRINVQWPETEEEAAEMVIDGRITLDAVHYGYTVETQSDLRKAAKEPEKALDKKINSSFGPLIKSGEFTIEEILAAAREMKKAGFGTGAREA
jgi:hypothetical protein